MLSFGIRDNWHFDTFVANRHSCSLHGFDPSFESREDWRARETAYASSSSINGQMRLHNIGLSNTNESGVFPPGAVWFEYPGIDYLRRGNTVGWDLRTFYDLMRFA